MKNKILLLLFLVNAAYCLAQQYIPFPTSNAVWRENGVNFSSGVPGTYDLYYYEIDISRDTFINGYTYHEVQMGGYGRSYLNYVPYNSGPPAEICHGAFREDSLKHIFYYNYWTNTEFLLYDFNLSLGDTLPVTMMNLGNDNIVTAIDSISINGIYHKRYQIESTWNPGQPFAAYIEGVGSTMGLTGGELHITEPPFEVYSWLICFSENGSTTMIDTLSSQSDCDLLNSVESHFDPNQKIAFTIFPNPVISHFSIRTFNSEIGSIAIYDVLGNKVYYSNSDPESKQECIVNCEFFPPGIYFVKMTSGEKIFFEKFIKK